MARKQAIEPEPAQADETFTLTATTGEPMVAFPAKVVRPLRHMLTLLSANDNLPRRLSIVAALREEGVTYTALALAAILAHDTASTVGLVELNWEAPGLAQLIRGGKAGEATSDESGGRSGLAGVLTSGSSLDDVLVSTGLPNLTLLPAGRLPHEGRETIVRSARLRDLVGQFAARCDHLLLDVPAVAATSDSIPLARLGDAILLVLLQGVTPRRVVTAALDDLNPCTVLGVVLNRSRVAMPAGLLKLIPPQ